MIEISWEKRKRSGFSKRLNFRLIPQLSLADESSSVKPSAASICSGMKNQPLLPTIFDWKKFGIREIAFSIFGQTTEKGFKSMLLGGRIISGIPWELDHSRKTCESRVEFGNKIVNFEENSDSRSKQNGSIKFSNKASNPGTLSTFTTGPMVSS